MLKNTLINLLGVVIPGMCAIPAMAYLARAFDVELFGVLLLAYSILGYAGIFDAGFTRAVIRKIALNKSKYENEVTMGTALVAVLLLSLLPSIAIYFYNKNIVAWLNVSNELKALVEPAIQLIGIAIPFFLVGTVSFGYLEGKQKFLTLNKYKIFTGMLIALLPAVMVYYFGTLFAAISGLLIARVITCFVAIYSLKKALKTFKLIFNKTELTELIRFGGWITLSNIISPLMVYSDRFILSNVVGANKVAFYNGPADLIEKLAILPGAVSRTIFPLFSENKFDVVDKERQAYLGLSIALFIILLPLFLFSGNLMEFWLGKPYGVESELILKILLIGFFFNGLAQIPFSRVQALGKSKTTALIHLFEIGPYVVLLYVLMNEFGLLGAAYAWSIRMIIDFNVLLYFSKKYTR